MLSMPGGANGMFNIFEVDAETMTYDFEQIICVRYGVAYMITLTAPQGTYETAAPGLETVMTYFVFE
jgi:hypothetical protein